MTIGWRSYNNLMNIGVYNPISSRETNIWLTLLLPFTIQSWNVSLESLFKKGGLVKLNREDRWSLLSDYPLL